VFLLQLTSPREIFLPFECFLPFRDQDGDREVKESTYTMYKVTREIEVTQSEIKIDAFLSTELFNTIQGLSDVSRGIYMYQTQESPTLTLEPVPSAPPGLS
jgi:hypothetical protein